MSIPNTQFTPHVSHDIHSGRGKRMAIIASYFSGESYGLLGPQMAATVIQENTPYGCIVVAVTHEDDKTVLKKGLANYFGDERPVIGFSTLSGREDLFALARELKNADALTILAGPQSDVDYVGEVGWKDYNYRFKGLAQHFSMALHGPAEQAIDLLKDLPLRKGGNIQGLLHLRKDHQVIQTQARGWDQRFLKEVHWENIYRVGDGGLVPLEIGSGQVLQQIGCPYAARGGWVNIDDPVSVPGEVGQETRVFLKGCGFCDVAADKGFFGILKTETVLSQIRCLPEGEDMRKIPFELINENALPTLPRLLTACREQEVKLSQINLTLRADWFLRGEPWLREALKMAEHMGIRILLASVGFESFDDTILRNLNKGLDVETNLRAVRLMRRLKREFPVQWAYSRGEGAIHGFIHPTPWDTDKTWENIQRVIAQNGLPADILPDHSIPLIIHHASGLGDWIRGVETREGCRFGRHGSIIGWWKAM